MPSLRYRALEKMFSLIGVNKMLYKEGEQWEKLLADYSEKQKKPLNVHIGDGMMHCWGAMGFVPEARAVRQEYFKALGGGDKA